MVGNAVIKRVISDDLAEIMVVRQGACSMDCNSCGGCTQSNTATVVALNTAKAIEGDAVKIECSTRYLIKTAMCVYILPFVLFFVLYFIVSPINASLAGISACIGFGIGILVAYIYSKKMGLSQQINYTIVERI